MRTLSFAAVLATAAFSSVVAGSDALTILQKECVSCHTEAKRKGGLLIDSRESLLTGGDSGPAIVPGKSAESFLVECLFPDADSHMPPKGQLEPRAIETLEKWIDAGAAWDAERWAKLNLPERTEVATGAVPASYQPVVALALSPDGSRLAVGRGASIAWYRVVPGEAGKSETRLEHEVTSAGHNDVVQSLTFSPDGATLASGSFRSLSLWDPAKPEKPLREISEPFLGRLTSLRFLPDGKRLLVADSVPSQAGRLHEVSLSSDAVETFETAHRDAIYAIALSQDGSRYATASADKLVTVREVAKHKIVARLEGHTGYALAAAFSPEGGRLATAGDDEEIKVWDIATAKKIGSFASRRSGPLYGLAWLEDPTNSKRKTEEKDAKKKEEINTDLIVSIAESGKPSAFTDLKEHQGEQSSTGAKERAYDKVETALVSFAIDPKGLWSFAGGEDGKVYVWDEKGKLKQTLEPVSPEKAPVPVAAGTN